MIKYKETQKHNRRSPFLNYELNLMSILSAHHIGGGATNIMKAFSMLDLGGMSFTYQRTFYRSSGEVHSRIIKRCDEIIGQAMVNEIVTSIHLENKNKLPSEEILRLQEM